jgi:hypothetical protein
MQAVVAPLAEALKPAAQAPPLPPRAQWQFESPPRVPAAGEAGEVDLIGRAHTTLAFANRTSSPEIGVRLARTRAAMAIAND